MLYFRSRLRLNFSVVLILSIIVLSNLPELAFAHAEYERSEPGADAVVSEAPAEVHVWFTQELFRREGANVLEVFGPDGVQVDEGDSRIDDDDRTHMIVSLQVGLPAGAYIVRWRNLSAEDGDEDSGEFSFTVDHTAAGPSSQVSPTVSDQAATSTPAPAPSLTSPPTQASQPSGGLPCLGGFILGGGFLTFIVSPTAFPWQRRSLR